MKTIIITLVMPFLITFNNRVQADEVKLVDESYVNDIPFNTFNIFSQFLLEKMSLEEEEYVDDIPFNTFEVYSHFFLQKMSLEEEEYVDDIPFDTKKILKNINIEHDINSYSNTFMKFDDDLPSNNNLRTQ